MLHDIGCSRIGSVMCAVRFDAPKSWFHQKNVITFPKIENLDKTSCFSPPFVRSAVLHAHPVHRPHGRGGETLFHCAEVNG